MNSNNTPKKIDFVVIDFCKTISPSSKPEYIKLSPDFWCKQNECYDNVEKKVKFNGGKRQLGWRIQVIPDPYPKFMIEAVHHAIWIKENGDKIDITPQPDSANSIVFVEDNEIILGEYRIGERYQALMKDDSVIEYVRLCNLESTEYVNKTKLEEQPVIPKELHNGQQHLLQIILNNCK